MRDTQFAGFAKALYEELSGKLLIHGHPTTLAIDRPFTEQIIAQRAYDLVHYVLRCNGGIADIPDMTTLPEVSE